MPPKRKSPSGGKGLRSQLRVGDTDSNASSVKMLTRGRKQNGGMFNESIISSLVKHKFVILDTSYAFVMFSYNDII